MEPVPSGKAVEPEPHRHHIGPGTRLGSGFRSLPSVVRGTGESYLSSAWISPDRRCEGTRVAGVTPMRQNGTDEAGSGLLLGSDGGRKAGSLSAGRARVHGRGNNRSVVRSVRCLLQSPR